VTATSSRITIHDVAARAGVSTATVSKVVNGRYGVAAATNERVQRVIDELGYEPSLVARSLRSHRTNVIGILVADLEPFSAELLKGAARAIRGSGYELVVYSAGGGTSEQIGWEHKYLTRLVGTLIDGAVLVTPTIVDAPSEVPVVAVDPHRGRTGTPTVDSDNLNGARMATQHLLDLGHRRIGFVAGRSDLESSRLREKGYRSALAAAGIAINPKLMEVGGYEQEFSETAAHALLTLPQPPSAIFASNDLSAIGVLAVARSLGLAFQRIQFTSDLLPSDILGVSVFDPRKTEFEFRPGPIFANIILADEINRTTPKTQSSLLEAMNEGQVSLDHHTHRLPLPFMVLATQNPLEYQGTHPLPESQMDRFLLRIRVGYPDEAHERLILRGAGAATLERLRPVLDADAVLALQAQAEAVKVEESLLGYVMAIVQATRAHGALALGVSPRGSLALVQAARALALTEGRAYCLPDDIKQLAVPALAHRVILRTRWEGAGGQSVDAERVIREILQEVPVPR